MLTSRPSENIFINLFICELFAPLSGEIYLRAKFSMWVEGSMGELIAFGNALGVEHFPTHWESLLWRTLYGINVYLALLPMMPKLDMPKSSQLSGRQLHAFSMSVYIGTCFEVCGSIPILFMWILGMDSPFLHIRQEPRHPNWDKSCRYYLVIFLNRTPTFDWYVPFARWALPRCQDEHTLYSHRPRKKTRVSIYLCDWYVVKQGLPNKHQ